MFKKLPNRLPSERLTQLVRLLRAGVASKAEIDEIISGHMRLAIYLAMQMVRRFGLMRHVNDFASDALFELTEAVNNARERLYNDDITPYLSTTIKYRLKDRLEQFVAVNMPGRTIRYKFSHGLNKTGNFHELIDLSKISLENQIELKKLPVEVQTKFALEAIEFRAIDFQRVVKDELGRLMNIPNRMDIKSDIEDDEVETGAYYIPIARREEPSIELLEILQQAIPSVMHGAIIELRKQGYTIEEIAPKVGYGKSVVAQMITQVEELFIKYEKRT